MKPSSKKSSKKSRTRKLNSNQKKQKGENKMKNIKKFNWKKLIETIKTMVIYTAVVAGIAFYAGTKIGENNAKVQNEKIVETVRNLSQNK